MGRKRTRLSRWALEALLFYTKSFSTDNSVFPCRVLQRSATKACGSVADQSDPLQFGDIEATDVGTTALIKFVLCTIWSNSSHYPFSAVHQLRLFCTNKTSWDSAMHPSHAAPVEFPLTCEVKVNSKPLSINLRGKKTAAKVLAPHINKDNALYFGGQENKVELVYQNTSQKYVLSVAICEVRNADSLARKIRREKLRSKEEVLGASECWIWKGSPTTALFLTLLSIIVKKAALDDDIVMGDVAMGLKCPVSAVYND